jgi:hypothetical protein
VKEIAILYFIIIKEYKFCGKKSLHYSSYKKRRFYMNDYIKNFMKAMKFQRPERIPVRVSLLPATWMKYREELEDIVLRHPLIFGEYKKGSYDYNAKPKTYNQGQHVDAWGCVWTNVHDGGVWAAALHQCNISFSSGSPAGAQ